MRSALPIAAAALAGALPVALAQSNKVAPVRLPSAAEARAVCNMVVLRGTAIKAALMQDGVLDANNDGVPDAVTVGVDIGTMRGDWIQFRPRGASKESEPVEVITEGYEGKDYMPFGARWLPYKGRVYTLYFDTETLRHASYLGYIDASNTEHLVCDFLFIERETLQPAGAGDRDGVCRAVAQASASYLATTEVGEGEWDLEIGRRETGATGRITIDFANAGLPMTLALLSYGSGAGRGCDLSYFDAVAGDGVASSGEAHATLMKLQDIEIGERTGGRCDGRVPRWLRHGGLVYLDIASRPDGRMDPFHEVRIARKGAIETRCGGEFKVRWQVKSMGPEFK